MVRLFLFPLILLVTSAVFVWPLLFWHGYSTNMGSLQGAFLAMAERVARDGPWGWYPNWYLGLPFRFAGPPLTWWIMGAGKAFLGWEVLASFRLLMLFTLLAFPVSFYFLARKIFSSDDKVFKRRTELTSLISSVALIVLPSIGYIFPKAFGVGERFGFAPFWLQQDLPRTVGLALLPCCLILFWRLFEKITYRRLILAIFAANLLFLVDGVTALSLIIGVFVLMVVEGDKRRFLKNLAIGILALILALLLGGFYFTPRNLWLIAFSPSISGIGLIYFIKTIFQAALGLGPAIAAIFWLKVFKAGRHIGFILLWTLPFLALVLVYFVSNPVFLTEYIRFLPELEMGAALLFGLLVLKVNMKYTRLWVIVIFVGGLFLNLCFLPGRWRVFETNKDISKTLEFKLANWLKENAAVDVFTRGGSYGQSTLFSQKARIFLTGSTAFWLNEFDPEAWQVRGGIDHASENQLWARAAFQIRNSESFEETILWLKAVRSSFVVVHGENSSEYYHDYKNVKKFDVCDREKVYGEYLPSGCAAVFNNGNGDRVIRINSHMVYLPMKSGLKNLKVEYGEGDKEAIGNYIAWLVQGPLGKLSLVDNDYVIEADADKGQIVDVGVAYDQGWRAFDNYGTRLKTARDPVGNLMVFPEIIGKQEIKLEFREGWDLWLGLIFTFTAIMGVFFLPKILPKAVEFLEKGWEEED